MNGTDDNDPDDRRQALAHERTQLLERVEAGLEVPMVVLAFVWLALLGPRLERSA